MPVWHDVSSMVYVFRLHPGCRTAAHSRTYETRESSRGTVGRVDLVARPALGLIYQKFRPTSAYYGLIWTAVLGGHARAKELVV
jgi:hypothetical protein